MVRPARRPGLAVTVRIAEPADYPAIARLTVAAYRADGQLTGEAGRSYAPVLADVAARAGAGELLVAVDQGDQPVAADATGDPTRDPAARPATGAVLGSVLFVLPDTPYAELSRPGEAEFRMLAVDPAAQGRGVGEALVRACLDRARQRGARAVVICTRSFSAPAQRLYARLGFVREPARDWSPLPGVELLALRRDLTGQTGPPAPATGWSVPASGADRSGPTPATTGQSAPIRSSSS